MREYQQKIDLSSGLRPSEQPRNGAGLLELYNLRVRGKKLCAIDPIINPTSMPLDWPFPQLFCLSNANYLCSRNQIYTLDSSWVATPVSFVAPPGGCWNVVDYQTYVLFTNGAGVYVSDPSTGAIAKTTSSLLPVMGTICDYKGQLVAGNVTGYPTNAVVWGRIGKADLYIHQDDPTMGWRAMPWAGAVLSVKRLGDYVMAYGAGGSGILQAVNQPIQTMRLRELMPFGVAGRGAVGGDLHEHLVLDEGGCLWKITEDLSLKELGYREFFEPMLGTDILVSFEPEMRYYYISNGVDSYLLTPEGLSKTYQNVTSCTFYGGGAIGIFSPDSDLSASLSTDIIDFDLRSEKTITGLELGCTGSGLSVQYDMRRGSSGAFNRTPSAALNIHGYCGIKARATDFKVRISATSFSGLELDYLNLRYQSTDKRFMRRFYAGPGAPGANS